MNGIEKLIAETAQKLDIKIAFCHKIAQLSADEQKRLEEGEEYSLFRFFYGGEAYLGGIEGTDKLAQSYALMLPAFIESRALSSAELSKTEYLKKILLGECSPSDIHKYMLKYAVKSAPCFVVALKLGGVTEDVLNLLVQYGGNNADTAIRLDHDHCVLVKFAGDENSEYRSATDFAEFLAQSLQEELGVEVQAGVGCVAKSLQDVALSYSQATGALRYAGAFSAGAGVHSYKEYMLIRMLEDVPENKLAQYFSELTDESSLEFFEDEEMLTTAEEFLHSSFNVSETSRKVYVHRNTLLYRIDKIEKATGLNIRQFPDALSLRVLIILYRLLKK